MFCSICLVTHFLCLCLSLYVCSSVSPSVSLCLLIPPTALCLFFCPSPSLNTNSSTSAWRRGTVFFWRRRWTLLLLLLLLLQWRMDRWRMDRCFHICCGSTLAPPSVTLNASLKASSPCISLFSSSLSLPLHLSPFSSLLSLSSLCYLLFLCLCLCLCVCFSMSLSRSFSPSPLFSRF